MVQNGRGRDIYIVSLDFIDACDSIFHELIRYIFKIQNVSIPIINVIMNTCDKASINLDVLQRR
jgi:hypothetical protein